MMQTVKQLADELGVSKQAVHKKIEKMGIKNELKTVNRRLMIDDNHAKAIRKAFFAESDADFRQQTVNQLTTTMQEQEQTESEAFFDDLDCQPVDNISSTNRQPIDDNHAKAEPDRVCTVNQQPEKNDYKDEYIQHLLQTIERLEHEKEQLNEERKEQASHIMEMHKNAEKHSQQMEEMRLRLEGMEKQIALMAAEPDAAEPVEIVQQPEPQKKGFFARLFGW